MHALKVRLALAMRSATRNPESIADVRKLAGEIKITYQGLKKLLAGESKTLKAKTNAALAKALGVDPDWLATGLGEMHSVHVWPFETLTPEQWATIPPPAKKQAEAGLRSALPSLHLASTNSTDDSTVHGAGAADKEVKASRSRKSNERDKNK